MTQRPPKGAGSGSHTAATPATRALLRGGVEFTVHSYQHDRGVSSYGLEAAAALGVDPGRVFKTLLARVDGRLVVAVVPVSGLLDLKALAAAVGGKRAEMADPGDAERATGYVVGGISPLGARTTLACVVDSTAMDHASVLVSAGRRGLDVEVAPGDLVRLTAAVVAAVGRPG